MPLSPRLGHGLEDRGTEGHPSGSNIPIPFPLCLLFHHHVPCPQHRPPTGIWQGSGERTSLHLLVPHFGFKQVPQLPAGPGAMKSTHRVWGSLGRRSSGHPRAPVIHGSQPQPGRDSSSQLDGPKTLPPRLPAPPPRGAHPKDSGPGVATDLKTLRLRKCRGAPSPVSGNIGGPRTSRHPDHGNAKGGPTR